MSFKVGDKVVCIEGYSLISGLRLIKDEIYEVASVKYCRCRQCISVGIKDGIGTHCTGCGEILGRNECFHKASRFRPIDHSFGEKLAEEIQEEINQEQLVEIEK